MRLTRQEIETQNSKRAFSGKLDEQFYRQMRNELLDYKFIEEELGIDLITYVKATTQPILYIKNVPFNNEIKMVFMEAITIDDMSKDYIIWFSCGKGKKYLFPLKNYGKTWALTKEELL